MNLTIKLISMAALLLISCPIAFAMEKGTENKAAHQIKKRPLAMSMVTRLSKRKEEVAVLMMNFASATQGLYKSQSMPQLGEIASAEFMLESLSSAAGSDYDTDQEYALLDSAQERPIVSQNLLTASSSSESLASTVSDLIPITVPTISFLDFQTSMSNGLLRDDEQLFELRMHKYDQTQKKFKCPLCSLECKGAMGLATHKRYCCKRSNVFNEWGSK